MHFLFDGKYIQWGNRFLSITEAYLELAKKQGKIVNGWKLLTIFAKSDSIQPGSKYAFVLPFY